MFRQCCMMCLCAALVLPTMAFSEASVCEVKASPGTLSRFIASTDPSLFTAGTTETCGWIVGSAATAQQIDLYQRLAPKGHLKTVAGATVGGIVQPLSLVEMVQSEKDAVDQARADQKAKQDAWKAEAQAPNVCKYQLPSDVDTLIETMRTNMQADINGMSLSAADKQKLGSALNRLVNSVGQVATCDAARVGGGN